MLQVAPLKWTSPTFTPDLSTIHRDPNHQPGGPDLSLSDNRHTNTGLIQVALKSGREDEERPKGKWPIQNQAVNRPTSIPTFIRSTSSLLTFMASLYRSVLCASVTLSSQELSAVSVRYFRPTAKAIPTPTPHIQTLDFDLYLKKAVFDPPTYRLCC